MEPRRASASRRAPERIAVAALAVALVGFVLGVPAVGATPLPGPSADAVGGGPAAPDPATVEHVRDDPSADPRTAAPTPAAPAPTTPSAPSAGRLATGDGPTLLGADALTIGPTCSGTGADGPRVQAVYAYLTTPPDASRLASIRAAAGAADRTFLDSAARTGGSRQVRWVTDTGSPGCAVAVEVRQVSSTAAQDFDGTRDALKAAGLDRTDRKYLVWTEGQLDTPQTSGCGVGEYWSDDTPSRATNLNATNAGGSGTTYAMVDSRCWDQNGGHSVPAHELMHMLGAVQGSAPHHDNFGHCTDDYDAMCYGPNTVPTAQCPSATSDERLFDCGNDDYFHTDPEAGSYVCSHWNTALSPYLWGGADLQVVRPVGSLSVVPSPGAVSVSWAAVTTCSPVDGYVVSVSGQPDVAVGAVTSTVLAAPAGSVAVTVRARRGGVLGAARSARVTVPPAPAPTVPVAPAAPVDAPPFGDLLLTKVDRRNYGLLGFAIDPDTSGPIQVLVTMTGEEPTVVNADFDLAGLEDTHPGYGIRHGFLFLKAGVAPGEKDVCAWALDATGGPSTFLGCRHATIK